MLLKRIPVAVVLIGLLVGFCWLDVRAKIPGTYLVPLALVFAVLATGEMLRLMSAREPRPVAWAVYAGTLLTMAFGIVPKILLVLTRTVAYDADGLLFRLLTTFDFWAWPLMGLAGAIVLAIVGEMIRYQSPGAVAEGLGKSVLSIVYVGLIFNFLLLLRFHGSTTLFAPHIDSTLGLWALGSVIAVVKISDIGQYAAGSFFGRHKLAPMISPGKTWEGAVGGIAFALLASWLYFHVFFVKWGPAPLPDQPAVPAGGWIAFAVVLAVAGILGDLAESMLKRDAGVKDSSTWMPGLGGVLDVLDSLLFAAPAAYLFWSLGWVGR